MYDVVICIDAERPARTDFSREVIVGSHAHTPANRRSDSWAHGAHGGGAHGGGGALQAQGAGQPLHLRRYKLMRSPDDYDRDVRAALVRHALAGPNLFWGLTHSNVHWNTRKGGALVEASLVCDPRMRVGDAHALARRAHSAVLATVPDVIEVGAPAARQGAAWGRGRGAGETSSRVWGLLPCVRVCMRASPSYERVWRCRCSGMCALPKPLPTATLWLGRHAPAVVPHKSPRPRPFAPPTFLPPYLSTSVARTGRSPPRAL